MFSLSSSLRISTSALAGPGVGAGAPPPRLPNSESATLAGFFSGSMALPSQNSMPLLSNPKGRCEQAPRMVALVPIPFAMSVSIEVRAEVVSAPE
jgi:hypothetical protein